MTIFSTSEREKHFAAYFCIAYILIQIFQRYVFISLPEPKNLEEELAQGAMPIHICRSILLLLSFFFVIYVYAVIVFHEFKRSMLLSTIAFIGLLIFCVLEIGIRSVELFYIQLQLPSEFLNANKEDARHLILNTFVTFQSVQRALYFPLLFSQAIASVIIVCLFPSNPKINYLIKIAFGINAVRLAVRLGGMFLHVEMLNAFSRMFYLPLVIIIFTLLIFWLMMESRTIRLNDKTESRRG